MFYRKLRDALRRNKGARVETLAPVLPEVGSLHTLPEGSAHVHAAAVFPLLTAEQCKPTGSRAPIVERTSDGGMHKMMVYPTHPIQPWG